MKDVKGYEGLYAITSCGKVWSYRRKIFLSPGVSQDGYLRVCLHRDGKARTIEIHRLVAEAYIPNPEGKPQINHIDEVKTHNWIGNLEWATAKENVNHGTRTQRAMATRKLHGYKNRNGSFYKKAVRCIELDQVFESTKAAADALGCDQGSISKCCNGKREQHHGYHFEFVKEDAA